MQKTYRPNRIITCTTYAELKQFAAEFADSRLQNLAIFGEPGVGKTECFRRALADVLPPEEWATLSGHATPRSLYQFLFDHAQAAILIDDVDELLREPATTAMLKSALDTGNKCRIAWRAQRGREDDNDAPPNEFNFGGQCAILANSFRYSNLDVKAIYDRCLCIEFLPEPAELHREIEYGGWFQDAEVIDFVGDHLHMIRQPSFRYYIQLGQLRSSKMDWRSIGLRLLECQNTREEIIVQQLLDDTSFDEMPNSGEARVKAFLQLTDMSRAKYFRVKAELEHRKNRSLSLALRNSIARLSEVDVDDEHCGQKVGPHLFRGVKVGRKPRIRGSLLDSR